MVAPVVQTGKVFEIFLALTINLIAKEHRELE